MILTALVVPARAENAKERLEATGVLNELMAEDKRIPRDLLEKAPVRHYHPRSQKGRLFIGAEYGRGFAICRDENTGWAPRRRSVWKAEASQIGAAETDIFLLVMNDRGMKHLLESKFTLDASGGVAAGPVGRSTSAQTDAQMRAEILSWSRSRGVFAGMTLGGGMLRNDLDENKELYGKPLTNQEVLSGNVKPPAAAAGLIATFNKYSGTSHKARAK